jgi:hypothetical protein
VHLSSQYCLPCKVSDSFCPGLGILTLSIRRSPINLRGTPRTPDGQCGVSSAWLAEMLDQQYSIPSTFCEGSLIFDDQQAENVLDHCWLELNESYGDELILDLTCDQAQGFDTPIVFHAKADLDRQGVHYIARDRLSISDLPDSPIWPRYQTLLRNLSSPLP